MGKFATAKAKALSVRMGRRNIHVNEIKNKSKRRQVWNRRKTEINRFKRRAYFKRRQLRKKYGFEAAPYKIHTQESKRIPDETIVDGYDAEIEGDHAMDEFSSHFSNITQPKICITTSPRPLKKTLQFINELLDVFPDSKYFTRYCHQSSCAIFFSFLDLFCGFIDASLRSNGLYSNALNKSTLV